MNDNLYKVMDYSGSNEQLENYLTVMSDAGWKLITCLRDKFIFRKAIGSIYVDIKTDGQIAEIPGLLTIYDSVEE